MNSTEKLDVLDLIIETLKDHEKALDKIVSRLDTCINGESTDQRETSPIDGMSLESWR